MFHAKQKANPMVSLEVLHSTYGRARIHCHGLTYLGEATPEISERIMSLFGVKTVKITTITANILITYDPDSVDLEQIIETTETVTSSYAYFAHKKRREKEAQETANERQVSDASIPAMFRDIAAATIALGFSLAGRQRRRGAGRLPALALGIPIFKSGAGALIRSKKPNADTLSSAAILTSALTGRGISALTVILLHDIAELLTAYTLKRTKGAIRDMLSSEEETVWRLLGDGTIEKTSIESASVGDRIVAHTGEKIGVDGTVIAGRALIDQSAITGEYIPAAREAGSMVFAGTTIKEGTVTIRAAKVGKDTALKNIVRMVENATENKAPIQNYADRFSSSLLFLNIFLFFFVFAVTRDISRALSMLIIDFSCGLRLSTVAALCASVNTAARNGIFVKGNNHIETMATADTLILDKTGTVTRGKPQVTRIVPLNGKINGREVVRLAAAAEEASMHPMAQAILSKAKSQGWKIPPHGDIQVTMGRGVESVVEGAVIRVGNKKFMNEHGLHTHPFRDKSASIALAGESFVYVSKGDKVIGMLGISDPLRGNMKKSINRLRRSGIDDIVLLTGDLEQHAEVVASRISLDRYESEQMPEDKAKAVLEIQSQGSRVIMVGDGINDAAALAYSDVGIALGQTRTDIAMESADVIISSDNPMTLPALFKLSESTMQVIRQNFATAIAVNSVGLVLGGIGILPVFWGAVLHNSSTIFVVMNSLRLLTHKM